MNAYKSTNINERLTTDKFGTLAKQKRRALHHGLHSPKFTTRKKYFQVTTCEKYFQVTTCKKFFQNIKKFLTNMLPFFRYKINFYGNR